MERHPLDPVAFVVGVLTILGGVVALLHQSGAIDLGVGAVVLLGCIALGVAGVALVALFGRAPATADDTDG